MTSLRALMARASRVEHLLAFHQKYLAHLPAVENSKPDETLAEHMILVMRYFELLCETHGLGAQVERLLDAICPPTDTAREHLKWLFVEAVAFHDFGKINENYQAKKMKNNLFRYNPTAVKTYPPHGHSELGAFIFIVRQLEEMEVSTDFSDDEKNWLSVWAMLLGNSILLHHSARMDKPPLEKLTSMPLFGELDSIKRFLESYQFTLPEATKNYFEHLKAVEDEFFKNISNPFATWALLRLHFSLLTAADYIATGEYMNNLPIHDFGLLADAQKTKIIENARTTEDYNAAAFAFSENPDFQFQHPTIPNSDNLNRLRTEMAVEVLHAVQARPNSPFYYLEAPTGGGKTNLSMLAVAELLRLDASLSKVFYVFPFTTLISQTYAVIKKTFGLTDDEVALMHSKAGFQQKKGVAMGVKEEETEQDADYGDEKKDFMENQFALYPVCLLTHIRFFDILKSNSKEAIYLMHRLANSIVVIDELQSYSPSEWDRMLWHIDHYGRLFNMRFVLMSATLPKIDELEIGLENRPHFVPLILDAKQYFQNPNFARRIDFNFELLQREGDESKMWEINLLELATFVLEKSKNYAAEHGNGSIHTIIEFIFKKAASDFQTLFEEIEKSSKSRFFDEIFVLSGTILEPRRREVIHFLKKKENRQKRVLLISTQVVEAGVDIDMDLGFKNISLLDSDEQLAGRVNRNVKKQGCTVFLFKYNEPNVIYGKDYRFKIMREELSLADQKDILQKKDFQRLYEKVFARVNDKNRPNKILGAEKDFPKYRKAAIDLDSKKLHDLFKLIDSDNFSVFVPLQLPVFIEGEDQPEAIFTIGELTFLQKHGAWQTGDLTVDGVAVWALYRMLKGQPKDHSRFVERSVEDKRIQGILSKFTFSLFDNSKTRAALQTFCGDGEAEDKGNRKSFEDYLYLSHWAKVYTYETGLSMTELHNSEYQIL